VTTTRADDDVAVVRAWHAALNAGDIDRLVELSAEDVEVGGPRGTGNGAQLLREWFVRAGVRIEPLEFFPRGDVVVVEQAATWPGGEPQPIASIFAVRDGRVARVIRYASLEDALAT
jgi:ketosteroid isomerase-like protein